jgi:hypothetical protein
MIETEEQLATHLSQPFDEFAERALAMRLQSSEVIISTFPKCGTTWVGQICHGLRTKGDMSFPDLGKVIPWFEMGHNFGHDLSRPQPFTPHVFKSHMELSYLPKGGKVINIVRNPGDALVSFYNFWADVVFDPSKLTVEMMARQRFLEDRSDTARNMYRLNYFQHLVDFHTSDFDGPVLFIAYEDMKLNLPAAVRRIAKFMDIELSKTLERLITEQSTFEFMSRHKDQFREVVPNGSMDMVVSGQVGAADDRLTPELKAELDEAWQRYVTPILGYRNYEELRSAISLT